MKIPKRLWAMTLTSLLMLFIIGTLASDAQVSQEVKITEPTDGAVVMRKVGLVAEGTGFTDLRLSGSARFEYSQDGQNFTLIDVDNTGSDGFIVLWDTTTVADGKYFVKVILTDAQNKTGSAQISVTVNNQTSTWNSTSLYQWGLTRIKAQEAWKITQGSPDIIVAVIDTGIDYKHPDLDDNMWVNTKELPGNGIDDDKNGYIDDIRGWDFRDNDNDSLSGSPLHFHGTFVAGIIAAEDNGVGITGVAPKVKLMDLRFLDSNNSFSGFDWPLFIEAINYAVANGAKIINMSIFANGVPPDSFHQAVINATKRGVLIVGITGNRGAAVQFPGKYEEVIAVAAINAFNKRASYSNFGPEAEIAAPGGDCCIRSRVDSGVLSTIPRGQLPERVYGFGDGTSFAAPHVAGVIALLLSVKPDLTLDQIRKLLQETSEDLGNPGRDEEFGYGLINAAKAVSSLK